MPQKSLHQISKNWLREIPKGGKETLWNCHWVFSVFSSTVSLYRLFVYLSANSWKFDANSIEALFVYTLECFLYLCLEVSTWVALLMGVNLLICWYGSVEVNTKTYVAGSFDLCFLNIGLLEYTRNNILIGGNICYCWFANRDVKANVISIGSSKHHYRHLQVLISHFVYANKLWLRGIQSVFWFDTTVK